MKGRSVRKPTVRAFSSGTSGRNGKRRRPKDREEEEGTTAQAVGKQNTPSPKKTKASFLSKCKDKLLDHLNDFDDSEELNQRHCDTERLSAYQAYCEQQRYLGEIQAYQEYCQQQRALNASFSPPAAAVPLAVTPIATGRKETVHHQRGKSSSSSDWIDLVDGEQAGQAEGITSMPPPPPEEDQPGQTVLERLASLQARFDSGTSLQDRDLTACLLATLTTLAAREEKIEKLTQELADVKQEFVDLKGEMASMKDEIRLLKEEKEKAEIRIAERELIGRHIPNELDLDQFRRNLAKGLGLSLDDIPSMQRLGISPEQADRLKARGVTPTKPIKMSFLDVSSKHRFLARLRHLPAEYRGFRFDASLPPSRREMGRELLYTAYLLRKKHGAKTQLRYKNGLELYIAVKLPSDDRYTRYDPTRHPV